VCINMEEEGNAYTCLDTHTQQFTRRRTRKGTRGSKGQEDILKYVCSISVREVGRR